MVTRKKANLLILLACGVIGNTTDFDSVVSGSIPDTPARILRCDYDVAVASQIVILIVRVQLPLVTPK